MFPTQRSGNVAFRSAPVAFRSAPVAFHSRPVAFHSRPVAFGICFLILLAVGPLTAQEATLLRPGRVFDGETASLHEGWVVLVEGDRIVAAGPESSIELPRETRELELPGLTLLPGLIEGHAHLLLHPYDETPWTDQVLLESLAERTARGVVHAEWSLMAGITTLRDLGTEGAGYADAGLKDAIEKGVIPGPRLIVTTRAIVATGSYNPKGAPEWDFPREPRRPTGTMSSFGSHETRSAVAPTG